ncbi:MAG: transcription antitermination factor NusB [Pseudomonadota bacterium]|nr:transcription antitermination factor NusB [Pseudomonadota bacterium]
MNSNANSYALHYLASIEALEKIITQGEHISQAVNSTKQPVEKSRLRAIVSGVIRHIETLTNWANQQVKFKPKDRKLGFLLLSGLYQCHIMNKGKKSELIYQAANVTEQINRSWAKPLVYAVLKKSIKYPPAPQTNLPDWLIKKLKAAYSEENWAQIQEAFAKTPNHITVRVDTRKTSVKAYQKVLQEKSEACNLADTALHIETQSPLSLPGLTEQQVYIQDSIHQYIPTLLPQLPERARVLDACAAPGGKSAALLLKQPNITLLAIDKQKSKISRLKENLRPFPQAEIQHQDALQPEKWWDGELFDAILCDTPCSATGLIQKHPEVKINQNEKNIQRLAKTQQALLQALWPLLRNDGFLLYSSCSILPEENEQTISLFLQTQAEAQMYTKDKRIQNGQKTFIPSSSHTGGYVAIIQKKL